MLKLISDGGLTSYQCNFSCWDKLDNFEKHVPLANLISSEVTNLQTSKININQAETIENIENIILL